MGRVAALSHKGRKRTKNEDSILTARLKGGGYLLVVADGVGGQRAGEVASRGITTAVGKAFAAGAPASPDALRDAIVAANAAVWAQSLDDAGLRGMASTVVAAVVIDGQAWLANVGDSRAYIIERGVIRQLTDDHSLVAQRVRDGEISGDEAKQSPTRNIITRSVGFDETVEVDIFGPVSLAGAVLLLCSDGLTDVVAESEIASIVSTLALEDAAQRLVLAANEAGGPDNISVILYDESGTESMPANASSTETSTMGAVFSAITGAARFVRGRGRTE